MERKVAKGEIINEVFLSDVTSTVTCEAFEKSTIIKFNKKDFIDIMENDFNLVKNIIKVLKSNYKKHIIISIFGSVMKLLKY